MQYTKQELIKMIDDLNFKLVNKSNPVYTGLLDQLIELTDIDDLKNLNINRKYIISYLVNKLDKANEEIKSLKATNKELDIINTCYREILEVRNQDEFIKNNYKSVLKRIKIQKGKNIED